MNSAYLVFTTLAIAFDGEAYIGGRVGRSATSSASVCQSIYVVTLREGLTFLRVLPPAVAFPPTERDLPAEGTELEKGGECRGKKEAHDMRSVVVRVSSGGAPALNMSFNASTHDFWGRLQETVLRDGFKRRFHDATTPRGGSEAELLLEQRCPAALAVSGDRLNDLATLSQQSTESREYIPARLPSSQLML